MAKPRLTTADPSNKQGLCAECHTAKTERDVATYRGVYV